MAEKPQHEPDGGAGAGAAEEGAEDPDAAAPLLIGTMGKKYVVDSLEQRDPTVVIPEMQEALSIATFCPVAGPAIAFLDLLGATRADVHSGVMECLRTRLLEEVERMPPDRALVLLCQTLAYMSAPEVTPICVKLLQRAGTLPEEVLAHLAEPDKYSHVPLEVRRQIWRTRNDLFREAVFPLLQTFITDSRNVTACNDPLRLTAAGRSAPKRRREADAALNEVCDLVGGRKDLYLKVLGFLRTLHVNTGLGLFCTLRVAFLMAGHDREGTGAGVRVSRWDPRHGFAWPLDAAIRDGRVSVRAARAMSQNLPPHGPHAPRTPEDLGDLAMVLRDPHALHTLCATALHRARELAERTVAEISAGAQEGDDSDDEAALMSHGSPALQHKPRGVRAGVLGSAVAAAARAEERRARAASLVAEGAVNEDMVAEAMATDEVLLFIARGLALAHATVPLLKGEAAVPRDDRGLGAVTQVAMPWLLHMMVADARRATRAAARGRALEEVSDDDEHAAGAEAGGCGGREGECEGRAAKRPRREAAGARGRALVAEAARQAREVGEDPHEDVGADADADEARAWGGGGHGDRGGHDDAGADADPDFNAAACADDVEEDAVGEDGDCAGGERRQRLAFFARDPGVRRLVLYYALNVVRARDAPRAEQLLRLAGTLADTVDQHLDFVYTLVELITRAEPDDAAAAGRDGSGGGEGGAAAADPSAEEAPSRLVEAALRLVLLPLSAHSATCHEQLVKFLCFYAQRAGHEPAAEVAKWAAANGESDEQGLVDSAYRELLRVVPVLRGQLQLPSARAAVLKKSPSSAASDVCSDGTHMEVGLQHWSDDEAEAEAEQAQ